MTEDDAERQPSEGPERLPARRFDVPPLIPPSTLEALRQAVRGVGLQGLDLRVASASGQLRETVGRITSIGEQWSARLAEIVDAIPTDMLEAAAELGRRVREAFPPNWRGLESGDIGRILRLAQEGTLCLVWTPRSEVMRDLLAAPDHAAREAVLVAARSTVIEDVGALIDSVGGPEVVPIQGELRELVREALDAAEAGYDRAAQALLAVALTSLLQEGFGFARLSYARDAWQDEDPEDAVLGKIRLVCIQRATVNALVNTDTAVGGFNRHGTLHGVSGFMAEPAMLAGFLLLAAWVRELAWYAEHHPEVLTGEDDEPDDADVDGPTGP
jgi:hypothetical protein